MRSRLTTTWRRLAGSGGCWATAGLAAACSACGRDVPQPTYLPVDLFEAGSGSRVEMDVGFDTLWTYGVGEDVLASTSRVAAFPDGDAAVLDILEQRIHRIGPQGIEWSWGRTGQGPRELRNARAMALNQADEVVIVDSGNRRMIWLSSAGEWLRERVLPPARVQWTSGTVRGVVALENNDYILYTDGPEPWIVLSEAVEGERRVPVPWTGFARMHSLQTQGIVAGTGDAGWAFGFSLGNGFFVFSDSDAVESFPYVEHLRFPTVITTKTGAGGFRLSYSQVPERSANDLDVRGDTLVVLTHNQMLDMYDLNTGAYHGTVTLPDRVRRIALWEGGMLLADGAGLVPAVTAVRMEHPISR